MKDDILNRQPFIDKIISMIEILSNEKKGISFAINGYWGSGKTFLLEKLESQIEKIKSEQTNDNKYFLFHYNCWQYDYYEEPSIAIVSAMIEKIYSIEHSEVSNISKATLNFFKGKILEIANEFAKNKIGIDLVQTIKDLGDEIAAQNLDNSDFDKMFSFKKTLDTTRKNLLEIANKKTIIIVVDELDRCLPNYAIKVLERIHHIFDGIDNIIVIFAIDINQLKYTIKNIFGNDDNFDIDRYLKKFINFAMNLDFGDVQENIWDKYKYYFDLFSDKFFPNDAERVKRIITELFKYSNIDIRNQEKIIERIFTIHKIINNENICDYSVLLFEIFVTLIPYALPDVELSTLIEINNSSLNLEGHVKENLINLLKELEDEGSRSERYIDSYGNGNGHVKCKESIKLTYYYLCSIFSLNIKYAGGRIIGSDESLKICKTFYELSQIIM